MLEISEIRFPLGERKSSVWALTSESQTLLFDSGCREDSKTHIEPALKGLGVNPRNVQAVIASHPDVDHFGGAIYWQQEYGAQIIAHRLDAALMENHETFLEQRGNEFSREFRISETEDGLRWLHENGSEVVVNQLIDRDMDYQLGEDQIKVLHLPGHSRGHLGVLDVKTRTLLISDAVLGSYVPYADGSPSFPPTYRFVKSYLQTIQRLLLLDFDSLGTAHYGTFSRQGGLRFLQESHDFALALETTIEGAIGNEPKTLPEIVEFVDSSTGLWPKPSSPAALAQPVFGHLEFLEEKEVIQRVKGSEIGWIKLR